MPLSTIINKLFVKSSGQSPSAVQVTANSIGAVSTAPGYMSGSFKVTSLTPINTSFMIVNGDPTFQQLIFQANVTAGSGGGNYQIEGTNDPSSGLWDQMPYILRMGDSGSSVVSWILPTTSGGGPYSPGNFRCTSFLIGIAGYSYVRIRYTIATTAGVVTTNNWTVLTTSSVPPVINPSITNGGTSADGTAQAVGPQDYSVGSPILGVGSYVSTSAATNTWAFLRTPNKFNTAIATNAGNTAAWTPAAGKKFRLMRYQIELSENATLAVAALITVKFQDNVTDFGFQHDQLLPATAAPGVVTGEAWRSGWIDIGNGYISTVANNVLNFNIGGGNNLTGGQFRINVCGTEE